MGTGEGSADELSCAKARLADVRSYFLRNVIVPCGAISDQAARESCKADSYRATEEHVRNFRTVWNEILDATIDDARVKRAFLGMSECVQREGHTPPPSGITFPWQEFEPEREGRSKEHDAALARGERVDVINRCSHESGYYQAQEDRWVAEMTRMFNDDPERVRPLLEEGLDDILNLPGPAPFLVYEELEPDGR